MLWFEAQTARERFARSHSKCLQLFTNCAAIPEHTGSSSHSVASSDLLKAICDSTEQPFQVCRPCWSSCQQLCLPWHTCAALLKDASRRNCGLAAIAGECLVRVQDLRSRVPNPSMSSASMSGCNSSRAVGSQLTATWLLVAACCAGGRAAAARCAATTLKSAVSQADQVVGSAASCGSSSDCSSASKTVLNLT